MPAVAPSLRNSVLVYQPLIISVEPPQFSRYSASDASSFTERSASWAGSKEVRSFLGGGGTALRDLYTSPEGET